MSKIIRTKQEAVALVMATDAPMYAKTSMLEIISRLDFNPIERIENSMNRLNEKITKNSEIFQLHNLRNDNALLRQQLYLLKKAYNLI